jgi:hypothetical protein
MNTTATLLCVGTGQAGTYHAVGSSDIQFSLGKPF